MHACLYSGIFPQSRETGTVASISEYVTCHRHQKPVGHLSPAPPPCPNCELGVLAQSSQVHRQPEAHFSAVGPQFLGILRLGTCSLSLCFNLPSLLCSLLSCPFKDFAIGTFAASEPSLSKPVSSAWEQTQGRRALLPHSAAVAAVEQTIMVDLPPEIAERVRRWGLPAVEWTAQRSGPVSRRALRRGVCWCSPASAALSPLGWVALGL